MGRFLPSFPLFRIVWTSQLLPCRTTVCFFFCFACWAFNLCMYLMKPLVFLLLFVGFVLRWVAMAIVNSYARLCASRIPPPAIKYQNFDSFFYPSYSRFSHLIVWRDPYLADKWTQKLFFFFLKALWAGDSFFYFHPYMYSARCFHYDAFFLNLLCYPYS